MYLKSDVAGDEVLSFNRCGGAQVSAKLRTVLSGSGSSVTPLQDGAVPSSAHNRDEWFGGWH